MPIKKRLIQCLKELKKTKCTNPSAAVVSNAKSSEARNFIFQAGRERIYLAEKKEIGSLMIDALIKDREWNSVHITADIRYDTCALKKKSALGYLIYGYKEFPVENMTLSKKLAEANIQATIEFIRGAQEFYELEPLGIEEEWPNPGPYGIVQVPAQSYVSGHSCSFSMRRMEVNYCKRF